METEMTNHCERHCEATAFKIEIKNLKWEVTQKDTEIHRLKAERDEIYALLGSAHLELRQNLEYGYNINTIKSTLISVGRYYPKLKEKMDELQAKMGDKL
jgi:predicted RNase H-like nuclease (RuvC/YqgF family)